MSNSFRSRTPLREAAGFSQTLGSGLDTYLHKLDLGHLVPMFEKHAVTLPDLKQMTREDLAEMGVPIGPRNRILNSLAQFETSDKENSYECPPEFGGRRKWSAYYTTLKPEVDSFLQEVDVLLSSRRRGPLADTSRRAGKLDGVFEKINTNHDFMLELLDHSSSVSPAPYNAPPQPIAKF